MRRRRNALLFGVALPIAVLLTYWILIPVGRMPVGVELLSRLNGYNRESERYFREYFAALDTQRALEGALVRAETRELARATSGREGFIVERDRGAQEESRELVERVARGELAAIGAPAPRHPVRMILRRADSMVTFPPYRRVTILPEAPDRPCVVVILQYGPRRPLNLWGADRLLGTCGFYAAFGPPGAGMGEWLSRTGMRRAGYLQPLVAGLDDPVVDPFANNSARSIAYVVPCRDGRPGACDSLFNAIGGERAVTSSRPQLTLGPVYDGFLMTAPGTLASTGHQFTYGLLATLVEEVGRERFATIWSSADPPSVAYERVTGTPLAQSLRGVVAERLPILRRQGLTMSQWLASAVTILLGASLALGMGRRELG